MFPILYILLIAFSDIAIPVTTAQVLTGKRISLSPITYLILLIALMISRYLSPINYIFFDLFIYIVIIFIISKHDYSAMAYQIGFFIIVSIIILPLVNIIYYYLFNGYYEYDFILSDALPHSNIEFTCKMLMMITLLYLQSNKIQRTDIFEKKYWDNLNMFSILCFLSLVLLTGFSVNNQRVEYYIFYSTLSGIIIILLYMFNNFFKTLYESIIERHRLALEQEKTKIELDALIETQRHFEEIKRFRHDMKNNFVVLQHLLANDKIQQAKTYLKEYISDFQNISQGLQIDNLIINALVNDKIRRYKNIRFDVKCFIPSELAIEDIDIVTILGNLLDNACEYFIRNDLDETVYLKVSTHMDSTLYIEVKNVFLEKEMEHDDRFTSKTNKEKHGYGLQNVEKCVSKYQGTYIKTLESGFYVARIIIPEGGVVT